MRDLLAIIGLAILIFGNVIMVQLAKDLVKSDKTIARLTTQCGIDPALTAPLQKVEAERAGK